MLPRFLTFLLCQRFYTFYPRDAMLAQVIAIITCLSVCLSVCPSVTRRYCVKTKTASGMISSLSGSLKTLVFRRQISSPNSKGFPPNGASNKGRSGKFSDFYPRDAMLARVIAITTCLSVRLSVRPSRAGIVSKRRQLAV